MKKKQKISWLKHFDFIVIDILSLQLSFIISYLFVRGAGNPYNTVSQQYQALLLFLSQLIILLFTNSHSGILRRTRREEEIEVIKQTVKIILIAIIFMFIFHNTEVASRLQFGFTAVFYIVIDFIFRSLNKRRIRYFRRNNSDQLNKLVVFTSSQLVFEAERRLNKEERYIDFKIAKFVTLDKKLPDHPERLGIPVEIMNQNTIEKLSHEWVDEAFILQSDDIVFPTEIMNTLMSMGISVSYTMSVMFDEKWSKPDIRKLGEYTVITNSFRFVPAGQLAVKRLIDIIGGFIGCLFTGILCLFVAPAIKMADPGPVFFTQKRVGQNGRIFNMHKFRSMYMNAEERKAELMSQNQHDDGMMFKIEDDPRIIGSEKKDANGKPKGIGNFIRRTSIDEFPQFFDCLIGNLSLVGWRPCTLEEWTKYDVSHRIRASMKPGITGLWQVSGRSKITDFEQVVELDREYIENWSLLLDLKILIKTFGVVLRGEGAE